MKTRDPTTPVAELSYFGAAQATAWHEWFHVIETAAQPASDMMIERAAIGPGDRVLDVATGLGEPAVTAARRIAPDGHVTAIDLSDDMLAFGRRRAAEIGLDNITFRQCDAAELTLEDNKFDAILCRWGLMFFANLDRALERMRAVLSDQGRFVALVWGPPERVPTLSLSGRVLRRTLGMAPPDEGAITPFALADHASLESRVAAAGFSDVRGETTTITFDFADAAEYTAFRYDRSGRLRDEIKDFPAQTQTAAWQAVTDAAAEFARDDGGVRMDNEAYCITARR